MTQQVTATLTLPTVNMMPNDNRCFVCGKTDDIGCCCPDVQYYNCDSFGHFSQDCPEKIPPLGTPHCHARSHFWLNYDHSCRDKSQSFITDAAKDNASTSQDHITSFTVGEAPANIRGTHLASHHTTIAVHDTHLLKDALGNNFARTHCTSTTATCLQHPTLPTGVTLTTIPWTNANLF